mgnify:CR=1 FL=1
MDASFGSDRPSWLAVSAGVSIAALGAALFALLARGVFAPAGGLAGFLLGGLSWAAFILPGFLWFAALVLFLPGFRADLLFVLVGGLLPFASVAALARFLDDPSAWTERWPAFARLGVAGTVALWAGLALGSSLAIAAVRRMVFVDRATDAARAAPVREPRAARAGAAWAGALSFAGDEPYVETQPSPFSIDDTAEPTPPNEPEDDVAELRAYFSSLKDRRAEEADGPDVSGADESRADPFAALDTREAEEPEPQAGEPAPDEAETAGRRAAPDADGSDEEPIPLLFGRRDDEAIDPAASGDFWADDTELVEDDIARYSPAASLATSPARAPLLPTVEVFQDGEHKDALRRSEGDGAEPPPDAAAGAPRLVKAKPASDDGSPVAPPAAAPARPGKPGRKPPVHYAVPTDGILMQYPDGQYWIIDDKTRRAADVLRETLKEFNIEAEVTGIRKGPVITMFEILPAPGVRLSKIANLADNIALRLAASSVRIVAPIPGKHAVGIEVPNERRSIVSFREIVENPSFKDAKMEVPVVLGKDISGEVQVAELTQTPHLLIAGATGSGKSVCVNSIILSILYRRSFNEVKLILIDPKIVELKLYNGIPHLLTPVITEPKKAFQALQYCICEMERRYSLLDAMGVRDIRSYNRKISEKEMATDKLPYIVVVIDEFADLMATTGKELESTLARLAAMSRAVGIHLVLATQRPSIDVITGLIKANIPSRIAFMVASKFDSRIIIDMVGAEKLLGRGDMLYAGATDAFPMRMQGAFVSDDEVERVVAHVKTLGEPDYIDDEIFIDDEDEDEGPSLFDEDEDDPLFEKALEIVLAQGKASASFLQRKLKIGYNRAARIVELMEEKGIVGKAQGSKPRDLVRNPELGGRVPPNPKARYVPDFGDEAEGGPGPAEAEAEVDRAGGEGEGAS